MKKRNSTNRIMILANNSGGLYIFRSLLMETLIERGYQIDAYTPFSSRIEEMQALGIHLTETPMERRGMNPFRDFGLFRMYRRAMKQTKPDFVITYTIKPGIYGGFAARLLKIPYAINITGIGTAFQKDGWLKRIVKTLYRIAAGRAKVVFFENGSDRQFFVDEKIIRESQAVVLHGAGVNLDHFRYLSYPPVHDAVNFLFVGRIMKEKGVDELFAAMKRLVGEGYPCRLSVVGFTEEDYEGILEQYHREGWLTFHGFSLDVRPFIQESDCAVLPSWHEGMSNTNLECAASGRPLVTSDIPGCREAVIDGQTGFLCRSRDADSLYDALKRMILLPPAERERMGKEGRRHMEEVFDKRKVVDETIRHMLG